MYFILAVGVGNVLIPIDIAFRINFININPRIKKFPINRASIDYLIVKMSMTKLSNKLQIKDKLFSSNLNLLKLNLAHLKSLIQILSFPFYL